MKTREEVIEYWRTQLDDFVDELVSNEEIIDEVSMYVGEGLSDAEALDKAIAVSQLYAL